MIEVDLYSDFEDNLRKIHSSLSIDRDESGDYISPQTQAIFKRHTFVRMIQGYSDTDLTEEEKQGFIELMSLHLIDCYFEGQKLTVPCGQGRSVKLAVFSALDAFKYYKGRYSKS